MRLREFRDRLGLAQIVILQHVGQPLARTLRPRAEDDAHLPRLQIADMADHGLEHVGVFVRPFGDEVAAAPRLAIDDDAAALLRHREGRHPCERQVARALGPFLGREIQGVGGQRTIGRDAGLVLAHAPPGARRNNP